MGCGREIEIEAFPLLAVICLGLNSKVRPLLGLTIHYHVMFTEHSTQLVKTPPLCRKKIFSCQEQLSRAAHAKRHLMETPLVMLTGHQLHHRDFQGPGGRQVPTATSSHRQPDHSVLGEEWVWCVPVFSYWSIIKCFCMCNESARMTVLGRLYDARPVHQFGRQNLDSADRLPLPHLPFGLPCGGCTVLSIPL